MTVSVIKHRQETWRDRLREFAEKPSEQTSDKWGLFLKELGLTNDYYLAVCEVLRQGRWTKAEHPRAYVKKAAMVEARKMHLRIPYKDDTLECGDSHLVFMGGNQLDRSTTPEGIRAELEAENREHSKPSLLALKGKHFVREQYDSEYRIEEEIALESKPRLPDEWWIKQEPPAWYLRQVEEFNHSQNERHIHAEPTYTLDLKRLADEAGFDPWELKVLWCRKCGIGREAALRQQRDERSRKALQAAWKRFERTGMQRLQECVKKNQSSCPG